MLFVCADGWLVALVMIVGLFDCYKFLQVTLRGLVSELVAGFGLIADCCFLLAVLICLCAVI